MWIKTKGPLKDGWYWWKCKGDDPEPECLQICNGYIIDKRPAGLHGADWEVYEHRDYSGLWYGPIQPPDSQQVPDCEGKKDPISPV